MADPTQSPAAAPTQFGKYLLDGEIATGGMSRVLRARLRGPGGFEKKLVVKQILPELARDPRFIELFVQEANTLVQMSHAQIVPVYELGVVDGVYFLSMEFVDGATVAEILRDRPLSQQLTAHIGLQIGEALQYAHEKFQVVHRDVTPRNVIVDSQGNARLLDFGIALPVDHGGREGVFGSPGYMSPEQVARKPIGPRSDLFSLGALLHECITGKPTFPGAHTDPHRVTSEFPVWLTECDLTIATLINGMLEKEPEDRPAAARQVNVALRTWLAEKHPEGVTRELAHRVEAAKRRPQHSRRPGPSEPPEPGGGGATIRSIATSAVLHEILEPAASTEPLQTAPLTTAATLSTGTGRRVLAAAALFSLLLGAAWMLGGGGWGGVADHGADAPRPVREQPHPAAATATTAEVQGAAEVDDGQAATGGRYDAVSGPEAEVSAAPGDPEQPADDGRRDAVSGRALLTINAAPWAQVALDGKPLGSTPRRRVPVRLGKHILDFECPPLGKRAQVSLALDRAGPVNVWVDMTLDPPRARVQ